MEFARLSANWNPTWAGLFGPWALGRGNHEVWLGRAAVGDGKYCSEVEPSAQRGEDMCVMRLTTVDGKFASLRFPLHSPLEWRFEVLDLCRFGGKVRNWRNPLTRRLFGPLEYTDTGCTPYVSSGHHPGR